FDSFSSGTTAGCFAAAPVAPRIPTAYFVMTFNLQLSLGMERPSRPFRFSGRFLFDRRADQVAPFGPRTVVVAHLRLTEQASLHKPGVRGGLANAAVGDHFGAPGPPLAAVKLAERLGALERPVLVDRLCPGHIDGPRNVAPALRRLRHARRRNHLAGKLIHRT